MADLSVVSLNGVGDQRKCIAYRLIGLAGEKGGVAGSTAPKLIDYVKDWIVWT